MVETKTKELKTNIYIYSDVNALIDLIMEAIISLN